MNRSTDRENDMTTEQILTKAGLSPELVRKMTTAAQLRSVRCPVCDAGAGRNCIGLTVGQEVHGERVSLVHETFPNVLPR